MTSRPRIHRRRSIRLDGYDYSQEGLYFVTLCTRDRAALFGRITGGRMELNRAGEIAAASWVWLSRRYTRIELDEYVVMPNHLHGIVVIAREIESAPVKSHNVVVSQGANKKGASRRAPTGRPTNSWLDDDAASERMPRHMCSALKPLGGIIGAFKTVSSRKINEFSGNREIKIWQRNYFEHVIRDEKSLERIREYIVCNPAKWQSDKENPSRSGIDDFEVWLASFKGWPVNKAKQ